MAIRRVRYHPKKPQGATDRFVAILRNDPCTWCGGKISGTCDHIIPRGKVMNGKAAVMTGFSVDHWTNLTAACVRCNIKRRQMDIIRFLMELNL